MASGDVASAHDTDELTASVSRRLPVTARVSIRATVARDVSAIRSWLMRRVLCVLVGSLALSACGIQEVPRLDVLHHVMLAQGFAVLDEEADVGNLRPGDTVVIDSTTTEPRDRWVMSNIVRKTNQGYSRYRGTPLWLLTGNGVFYCANFDACEVSAFPETDARPTEAELRTLHSELMTAEGFQALP
jgi:hypothetical protein